MSLARLLNVELKHYPYLVSIEPLRRAELEDYFSDFCAALSFPHAFDWNAKPMRWRVAMRFLSKSHLKLQGAHQKQTVDALNHLLKRRSL